ncbi:MAG TPA: DUF1559 domain-containing protein [Pirellulales bacterium]|nr:DUF1559 domain-containing protein [Pirellulales bacterium]
MSDTRFRVVRVLFVGLSMIAVPCGCGKSQPNGGNQVATAPEAAPLSGTVTYQPSAAPNAPAPGADPTMGTPPPSPAVGGPATGPSVGTIPGPTVTPSVPGPTNMPNAAGSPVPPPGVAGTPTVPSTVPPTNQPPASAPSASGGTSGTPVASGNVSALAAAVNKWHTQGTNLVGAKKFDDKPVLAANSWMIHLLPFLGHNDIHGRFDFSKGWHEDVNLPLACEEIPAFLDPGNPNRRTVVFGVKDAIGPAFTHYVGMAGVEDTRNVVAAEYPRTDPRAGIFGYTEVARPAEITDGTSNTIMVISSGKIVGPWASGGGATVRGARPPYFDDITGFGSGGNAGAVVAMADGSVKRISKNIDPSVFRALCTIHGGETVDLNANANAIQAQ